MRAVAIFLLCCCPLAAQAQSQSTITLTLQDAIARARNQGPAAQAARSGRDAARWRAPRHGVARLSVGIA